MREKFGAIGLPTVIVAGFGAALLGGCSSQKGRVVGPEYLARYEGGGSMSTLWYQGSDGRYHHFRHLHKTSTPYRVRRSDMPWPREFPMGSQELDQSNSLVVREFSEFLSSHAEDG